ncbi:MAG: CNNM domain-containing protein [Bacilli bacterium]|nr:CNNM domain-containing protein [Bacilli bacterium]
MNKKEYKEKYDSKIKKRNKIVKKAIDLKWIIQVSLMAFVISLVFSGGSGIVLESVNVLFGILIVIFFILVGVIFDMIGIAVASADQKPFHSMATKRVKGSKMAIKLIKNAEKVSAFCNDVIGDICNIISGSAGAVIAAGIASKYNIDAVIVALLLTAIIAALTIGGKAMGKSYAINKSEVIIYKVAKICNTFWK